MLSSLFGELRSLRTIRSDGHGPDDSGFAATALMESTATEVNDHGQMVDSHQSDLVVTGSAAQAIRDHFATTRADLDSAKRQITLLDPTGENRLMERVVSAFETSVTRLMPQLDEALQAGELPGIRHVAHTLKSSSASMGAVKLSKMCSELETMARQGQSDGMSERVAELQAEVEIVRVALKRMLDA